MNSKVVIINEGQKVRYKMTTVYENVVISLEFPSRPERGDHIIDDYFNIYKGELWVSYYRGLTVVLNYSMKHYISENDIKNGYGTILKERTFYDKRYISYDPREETSNTFKHNNIFFLEYHDDLWPHDSFRKVRRFYFENEFDRDYVMIGELYLQSKTKDEFDDDIYNTFVESFQCRLTTEASILKIKEKTSKAVIG